MSEQATPEHIESCPFCGGKAELHEWEDRDATQWAAHVKCTQCWITGPVGRANNRLGCYDAVNDLHKKRALEGWNKRHKPMVLHGTVVCHKNIPNATQDFIPANFYRESEWGEEYSKVAVYRKNET